MNLPGAEVVATSRFERRRRRNRAALIGAAIALFQERGTRATTLEAICERADVSSRTFFNHFASREHLYQAIAEQRAREAAAAMDAFAPGEDARDRLAGIFDTVGRYLEGRPRWREFVGEMLHLRLAGVDEHTRGGSIGRAALRLVADGVARGQVTRAHPPEVLADLLVGALVTAIGNWCAAPDFAPTEALRRSAAALADLYAPEPDQPRGARPWRETTSTRS